MRIPRAIVLYSGVEFGHCNFNEIVEYLSNHFKKIQIIPRDDIVLQYLTQLGEEKEQKTHELAMKLARAKVRHPNKEHDDDEPLWGEVEFEKRWLLRQDQKPLGLLYDAIELQRVFLDLVPQAEQNLDYLHIIIVYQLFGTWDPANQRYHARVSNYGNNRPGFRFTN